MSRLLVHLARRCPAEWEMQALAWVLVMSRRLVIAHQVGVCIVALPVDRRLSHVSSGRTSRSACTWLIAHTVQRPLEQLVERLLLCHDCFLCSVSPLIAASVCCYNIIYTSLHEHSHTSGSYRPRFTQRLDVILWLFHMLLRPSASKSAHVPG